MSVFSFWSLLVASKGYYSGNPEYVYRKASALWVKKTVDFIVYNNNVKNIKFDKK